jgi:hypothetical protein
LTCQFYNWVRLVQIQILILILSTIWKSSKMFNQNFYLVGIPARRAIWSSKCRLWCAVSLWLSLHAQMGSGVEDQEVVRVFRESLLFRRQRTSCKAYLFLYYTWYLFYELFRSLCRSEQITFLTMATWEGNKHSDTIYGECLFLAEPSFRVPLSAEVRGLPREALNLCTVKNICFFLRV